MILEKMSENKFDVVASFMAQWNENPKTQCLHSGEGAEAIRKQMEIWDDGGEFCVVGTWEEGELKGAFGCEFDETLGKGWLWGPFAEDGKTAVALFTHLLKNLPPTITQLQSYLNVENKTGDAFYRQQGFAQPKMAHVYVAARPAEIVKPLEPLPECSVAQLPSFAQLHDAIFPNTFDTGQDVVDKLDGTNKVFVWAEGDEVLGYLYAKVDASSDEGYVEFLGVAEQARRQGVGRRLLATAVYWLFHDQQVPQIALNVNDDNNNARSLYESVGFGLAFAGIALQRDAER